MAYKWFQNASNVTVTFPVPPNVRKTDIDILLGSNSLRAGVKGSNPVCEGMLFFHIEDF